MARDRNRLCIEDPFEITYNVARTVTKDGLYTIRGEFMRATRVSRLDELSLMLDPHAASRACRPGSRRVVSRTRGRTSPRTTLGVSGATDYQRTHAIQRGQCWREWRWWGPWMEEPFATAGI